MSPFPIHSMIPVFWLSSTRLAVAQAIFSLLVFSTPTGIFPFHFMFS